MPGPCEYLGLSTLGYPDYADLATGSTLVAEPGGSYEIRAINGGPVPPPDGRWSVAAEDPAPFGDVSEPPTWVPPSPEPPPEVLPVSPVPAE